MTATKQKPKPKPKPKKAAAKRRSLARHTTRRQKASKAMPPYDPKQPQKPGEQKPGEHKPGDQKPGETKPGDKDKGEEDDNEKARDSGQSTETKTPTWGGGGGSGGGERRGAGSGAAAVKSRTSGGDDSKQAEIPEGLLPEGKSEDDYKPENYDPESEYPAGDPTKGKPDFQKLAEGCDAQPVVMRDYREYLKSQALKNERANDEAQAQFVEGNKGAKKVLGIVADPDFQRDKSMQQLDLQNEATANMRSQEYVEKYQEQRAKELKQQQANQKAVEMATT